MALVATLLASMLIGACVGVVAQCGRAVGRRRGLRTKQEMEMEKEEAVPYRRSALHSECECRY